MRIEIGTASVVTAGRVSGVRVDSGDLVSASKVVIAAGCWSASVEGVPIEARPAVRPVKGQILRLRCDPERPLLTRTVRAFVHGSRVYLVPLFAFVLASLTNIVHRLTERNQPTSGY